MYKLKFHNLTDKDWKSIPKNDIGRIKKAVQKKLKITPEKFGKPLRKELKGYYRLRIDPYRVIYRIEKEQVIVFILTVGLRKDNAVYLEAAKRLNLF